MGKYRKADFIKNSYYNTHSFAPIFCLYRQFFNCVTVLCLHCRNTKSYSYSYKTSYIVSLYVFLHNTLGHERMIRYLGRIVNGS